MTPGTLALLAGLFVVPVALLVLGHRLRRRSPRRKAIFWGMLWGYAIASLLALAAGLATPAMWDDGDTLRGALGYWAMVVLPALGALIGAMRQHRRH